MSALYTSYGYRAIAVNIPPLKEEIKVNFPLFNFGNQLISSKKLISPDLISEKLISSGKVNFLTES